jgi:hypothetical protein
LAVVKRLLVASNNQKTEVLVNRGKTCRLQIWNILSFELRAQSGSMGSNAAVIGVFHQDCVVIFHAY